MKITLDDRLAALEVIVATGEGRIPTAITVQARELLQRATQRRQRSPNYTVVGIFGATGSGKSSLVNALVGVDVARTHVRRPTTSEALAVTWQPDGASDLLDWLQVRERVVREQPFDARAARLVLLDLPDFDSVELANREIAQRLAAQVDALVWVVDPQKYADEVMHVQFIAPHAKHSAVTLVVLNQIDLLQPADVAGVVTSLTQLLAADGLPKARVLPVSARTGAGVDALRGALSELAAEKAVREARLAADVATLADRMPEAGTPGRLASKPTAALAEQLAIAAGADTVARAVGGSYRKRAAQATGWPLVSWVQRLRADPLTRLGIAPARAGRNPDLHRTSMPVLDAGARAKVSLAVRGYADAAATGLTEEWRTGIRSAANDCITQLPDQLDLAIARTVLPTGRSWWWVLFTIVQWVAILAALTGVGWLLGAALLPTWGLPAFEVPTIEGWAVPTLLIVAGIGVGIALGLLGTILGAVSGASRRRAARRRLLTSVTDVAQRVVVAPMGTELERARAYSAAVVAARA